ncbi:hypothetical protein HPB49_003088 [Dermacentor silvarum]|uniref:Uncharacterized protein n=1 Tax=Dermacentor silvarum TaxID=543639 RepID=A0ACB8DM58_DERSI|nr:hypothetical protein HPB49_003088 [Dermacentor silvarum]
MEELVEGETISPQDYHPGEWQTVLRAYRNRAPASNSPPKPNSTASVQAKPNASNAGAPTDAASVTIPAAFKETPQLLRTTRAVVQKSKQLAALPVGTIRVVFRPRGELSLDKLPAPSLLQALRTSPSCSVMGALYIRVHPTKNTFTVATVAEATALALVKIQEITIDGNKYPVAAYIAAPPAAVKGVISRAYWNETPEQILNDLQHRNPEADIIAARRMGKTASILITFASGPVPHTIKYMCVVHRCTKYKGSPDACTNCRKPGHRYDVCRLRKTGLCPRCGENHETQEDPCKPKCIFCGGNHLTGTGSCKARTPQPRRQTVTKPKTAVPTAKDFPPLAPHQDRQQAWTKPTSTPPTSLREEEIAHLREEIRHLRAAVNSIPFTPPPPPLPTPQLSTPPPPPKKKRRQDDTPDIDSKLKDFAQQLEANILAKTQDYIEATITKLTETIISQVIVCLASLHRFFAAQYTSAYLLFVFTLVFTASATDLCRLHGRMKISNQALAEENDFKTSLLVLTLLTVFVTAGNMVVCGLRDTTVYKPKSFKFERAGEEDSWSPLGLFACAPIHRSLKNIIGKSTTNIRRFVKPSLYSQCARTVATLYAKAKNGVLPGSKGRLLYALWCVTWREVLWIMATGIAYYLTLIARALVLETSQISGSGSNPRRCLLNYKLVSKPALSSCPRVLATEQLRTKRGFLRMANTKAITKAISAIDALLTDEAAAVWLLHQHLKLALVKQADFVEFDRAIRETLTDADLEADLTTAFEYEQVSFTKTSVGLATEPRPPILPCPTAQLVSPVRSPYTRPCLLCNASHHTVLECSTSLTAEEKRRELQARRRCFRCAKGNYVVSECRSARNFQCAHCAGQPLTSLCNVCTPTQNEAKRQGNMSAPSVQRASGPASIDTPPPATSVSTSGIAVMTVFLQTGIA